MLLDYPISRMQRSIAGLAIARLEPSVLPMAAGMPEVAGGFVRSGGTLLLPEAAAAAACVIVAWLAGWTILGAWRMMTRDA